MPARKRKRNEVDESSAKFPKLATPKVTAQKKDKASSSSSNASGSNVLVYNDPDNYSRDEKCSLKISSWNVNGIRAWFKKDNLEYLKKEMPDIFCIQELKCEKSKIPPELTMKDYHSYYYPAEKPGYAGTGLWSKIKPINVTYGLGIKKHDNEGRLITAEYEKFYLLTAYVPNSGRGLPRLDYRTKEWDGALRDYMKKLDKEKPVILCGDLNVSHKEIDLANPKTNLKTAGFTIEERDSFSVLLDSGFTDVFRSFYPTHRQAYSYWSYMGNARAKDVGWRLDYFISSERFMNKISDCIIRKKIIGSDHCPVVLCLDL